MGESCGVKVRESSRSAIIMFMCAAFLLPFSLSSQTYTRTHAVYANQRINESTNQVHTNTYAYVLRTRFGLRNLSLLYVCSAAGGGGSITNIIGE